MYPQILHADGPDSFNTGLSFPTGHKIEATVVPEKSASA